MPKRKNVFYDTKLNEWLFDRLVNLTADQIKNLNHYELRLIRNRSSIKAFVANANLEKKLSLLTKVGVEWNLSFFGKDYLPGELIKKVYRQYTMKGKTVEAIDEMFSKKVFVLNSRDLAISLALMSLNCHSEAYIINPHFMAFSQATKAMKSANIRMKDAMAAKNLNVEHNNISRETKKMARLFIEMGRLDDFLSVQFNLQLLDAMILWLLYSMPYNYVSVDYIKGELRSKYKPASVGMRCAYLFRERKMIDKKPAKENTASYLITQEGIITVGLINNQLINRVYGE